VLRIPALLALALLLLASPAFAAKALFDDAHAEDAGNADWVIDDNFPTPSPAQSGITANTPGTYWTGAISSYGVDLVKRGYTVMSNTTTITYGNGSNPNDLSNYDVFIVPEPNTLFSSAEVTAILDFVHDGGGLIAISDHSGSDRNNDGYDSPQIWNAVDPTHALWGVHFGVSGDANNNITETSSNVAPSASDSITHGPIGTVTGLAFHNGTTLTLYPASNPTIRGEVWMTGVSQTSNSSVMAASCQYGSGRVFFICDSSPVDDGSARPGNSSIYDGWGESPATDSTLFLNATLWATRRNAAPPDLTPPTATVTSPNGGETWKVNSVQNITWTASDNVGVTSVDLSYSVDGGSSWTTIATGLANSGSYGWTIPNVPGTTNRVLATAHDAAGNTGSDASDGNFTIDRWIITASSDPNGTISPSGAIYRAQGQSQAFTITPSTGYHIADVQVDGGSVGAVAGYTFTNIAANHTIAASFAINQYTITASAGANGNISPSGAVPVNYGGMQAFSIAADGGYHIADVQVDGGSVGAVAGYTFNNVTAAHTIASSFAIDTYGLSVSVVGGGSVTRDPDQPSYAQGSTVNLTAVPSAGWAFSAWSRDTTTSANPISVFIGGARSYTATFVDVAPPTVTVTAPNGGESWTFGTTHSITWSASDNVGVTAVTLEYSLTGGGGPWTTIATGLANSGSYDWTVPSDTTTQAIVRATASDAATNAASDTSDAVFDIVDPNAGVDDGPAVLALARPAPNPGAGPASLQFSLPRSGHARLELIDPAGRRLAEFSGTFGPGRHAWHWDGRLADGSTAHAGLYFVRLVTPFGTKLQRYVRLE
jgi:hypothetical protein